MKEYFTEFETFFFVVCFFFLNSKRNKKYRTNIGIQLHCHIHG